MSEVTAYMRYQADNGSWINVGLTCDELYIDEVWPEFKSLVEENNKSKENKEDI